MTHPYEVLKYSNRLIGVLRDTALYLNICDENQISNLEVFDTILLKKFKTAAFNNYKKYDAPEITPTQLSECMADAILEYRVDQNIISSNNIKSTNLLIDHAQLKIIISKINYN